MTTKQWDSLWINALVDGKSQSVAVKDGNIAWIGDTPQQVEDKAEQIINVNQQLLTPGLIDCHTHLVFAGNRANEFAMRLHGATYEEIAKQGGGIQSTVTATRAASEDELFEQSLPRAKALQQSGVTTLEIKSGYGLDWQTETKMLRVAKRIEENLPLTVKRTFLGAHTVPTEYKGQAQAYVDLICEDMIPRIASEKLADSVDVFCENIAFSISQTEQIFQAAQKYQLALKCHGEQLTCSDSAVLAAQYKAHSVDHLEYVSEAGIEALAAAGTVAVLLPGAYYFLREKQSPPIAALRAKGVKMAIASDCNPGTSPVTSLLITMNMACTLFRLTPEEVMLAVTEHAAQALGMSATHGSLAVGKAADFAIWYAKSPVELCYYLGNQPLSQLVKAGKVVYDN